MYPPRHDQDPWAPQPPQQGYNNPYAPQPQQPQQQYNPYGQPQQQQQYNPYGQPQQQHNPYAPPVSDAWNDTSLYAEPEPQGTYWGGFAVGLIFALLGLIIVYVVGKDETKRGALHGLGIRFALAFLFVLFAI